jgi:N-acyl homoserine lactone hydrolase
LEFTDRRRQPSPTGCLPCRLAAQARRERPIIADGAYGPFARNRRLTARGDVLAVPTPGHTPDHLSIIVEDGDAAIFLAGDASYSEQTMLEGRIDGVSADEAGAAATLATIRRFAAAQPMIYLPTHDPAAAQRLTQRETVAGLRDTIPLERAGLATLPAQAGGSVNYERLSSATP